MAGNLQHSLLEPGLLSDDLILDADGEIIGAITPGGRNAKPTGTPGKTPFFRAAFLLSNCILGSGILGQAYAMRHSGIAVFVVSLVLMACVAAYGVWLLLCCCETTGLTSYEELGTKAFGRWGRVITTAAILMQNASAMTSYLVILGDLLPTLVREAAGIPDGSSSEPVWANRAALMTLVVVVIIVPLVSLRNIGTLGYSSGLSIAIMVFIACAAAVTASRDLPCPLPAGRLPPSLEPSWECSLQAASLGLDTFYVLPSLAFSFVCHTGLLPIYTELRRRDRQTMMRVAGVSMVGCLALYFVSAIFGYLAFRGAVSSDSLKSMTAAFPDDPLVTATRILVCVSVTVTVPLINYPARRAVTLAAFPGKPFSWPRHVALGVVIVSLILLIAILVPDVRNVFGAAGATTSVTLMAILPGVFYSRLHKDSEDPAVAWHVRFGIAFACLGALIGIVSFAGVVMSWVSGGK